VRIVVQEWERVLLYRDGRFAEALEPGRHRRTRVCVVVRPRLLVVPGQEVLTADGLSVKVSLTVACRTADPRRWHEAVEDADAFVYAALQVALREAVAGRTLDGLLAARDAVPADVLQRVGAAAEAVGVAVDSLALRDVMVPAELRRGRRGCDRPCPGAGGAGAGAGRGRRDPGAGQRRPDGGRAAGTPAAAHAAGRRGRRGDGPPVDGDGRPARRLSDRRGGQQADDGRAPSAVPAVLSTSASASSAPGTSA
jgi:hypothetical protein